MAILSTAKIVGMLASAKKTGRQVMNAAGEWVAEVVEDFMSGFAGYGWKIWEGKWMLEIDSIRVRERFIAFEMLVSKMRAIIGSLGISQACGKIATVTLSEDGAEYLITLEDETMSFVAHDFMRCQIYTGTKQSLYHVEISSVANGVIHVPVSEFDKDAKGIVTNPPEAGNDIVQFGNSVDKNRQSAIYIHADESGQPAIDIMFDIDSKDWTGKVKTRLGGDIPGGDGTRGFFCENGMIKGTDTSGHTVYCIYPDGTAEFGDGSAKFNTDKSGFIAGGAISWKWDSSKNKYVCTMKDVILQWENLGDVPDWITEWDTNKVQIGGSYMISPKLFTGKNTGTAEEPVLTGILQGDKCITIDGIERSGIYALVENKIIFELDPENKKYKYTGKLETSSWGSRITIDPDIQSVVLYDSKDNILAQISGDVSYGAEVVLRGYDDNNKVNLYSRINRSEVFFARDYDDSGSAKTTTRLTSSHMAAVLEFNYDVNGSPKSIGIYEAGPNGFRITSNDWHSVGNPVAGKTQVQADGTLKVVPF